MSAPEIDQSVSGEQQLWRSPESLAYYRTHRQSAGELYASERFFLPEIVPQVASMLDVGCAAGGFSRVVRSFNPAIRYVGVDIVPDFVAAATSDHPDAEFALSDGLTLPFPKGSFGLVHCYGVLHLNRRYPEMIRAMWEMTSRFLLCDLRLTRGAGEVGTLAAPFGEAAPEAPPLSYTVLNVDDAVAMFRQLVPAPGAITVKGYSHPVAGAATLQARDVIMAFFLAEKGEAATRVHVDLDAR